MARNSKKKTTKRKTTTPKESLAVGGQAVIEGVMMRNDDLITTAIRVPSGKIIVKKDVYKSYTKRFKVLGLPFIRGMVNLIEIMIIGMRIMIFSSNQQLDEDEDISAWELFLTILFAVVFSLAMFKFLPLLLATIFQERIGAGNIVLNLVDGMIKIILLTGYLWLISLMPDVNRLFQYHGAEHKTINCFENKLPLTVKNVLAQTRFHPRCGTTFIIFVFFVSVLFYMVIPLDVSFVGKLLLRILLLPIIAGVSYELIKFGGRHHKNPLIHLLLLPGLLLQRLTTKEPDAKQAEVGIKSLKAAIGKI